MQHARGLAGSKNGSLGTYKRRKLVYDLITSNIIRSQAELLERIEASGHHTTQATLSRDLKILKIGKLRDAHGRYIYALGHREISLQSSGSLSGIFLQGYQSLTFSGQLAVIHTLPGHGQSVAFALDELKVPGIIGTVAGDDTILAVLASDVTEADVSMSFKKLIPNVDGSST